MSVRNYRWFKQPRKSRKPDKPDRIPPKKKAEQPHRIERIRVRKRRKKHPGYTVMPHSRLGIFDNRTRNNDSY